MGVWGATIEIPQNAGFPSTLGYSAWALTMIPVTLVGLKLINWKLDRDPRSILLGMITGLTGSGGQLALFQSLQSGPAYIVFPIISLTPVITILMAFLLLRERTTRKGWIGIILAFIALPLLSYQPPSDSNVTGYLWLGLSLVAFFGWGLQGYFMKFANNTMRAESIFFYMMISGLLLMPIAISMTDFSQNINWGFSGLYLAILVQFLNSIGVLFLVYAFRFGKAIIVAPLTAVGAPFLTIVLSLIIYGVVPHTVLVIGMVFAITASYFMSVGTEETPETAETKESFGS